MVVAAAVPVLTGRAAWRESSTAATCSTAATNLVDAIKQEVFPAETYQGKEVGTVTIFQGDLRIATNVIGPDGNRAVGTRLSESRLPRGLRARRHWAAPAFVVDDWYITAYEPIRDPHAADHRRTLRGTAPGALRPRLDDRHSSAFWC